MINANNLQTKIPKLREQITLLNKIPININNVIWNEFRQYENICWNIVISINNKNEKNK